LYRYNLVVLGGRDDNGLCADVEMLASLPAPPPPPTTTTTTSSQQQKQQQQQDEEDEDDATVEGSGGGAAGEVGLCKLNSVVTHSLKGAWFQPLSLSSEKLEVSTFAFKFNLYRYSAFFVNLPVLSCGALRGAAALAVDESDSEQGQVLLIGQVQERGQLQDSVTVHLVDLATVGLYMKKLNPVDPPLESAWFQPLSL
jgi:hypothetical protein